MKYIVNKPFLRWWGKGAFWGFVVGLVWGGVVAGLVCRHIAELPAAVFVLGIIGALLGPIVAVVVSIVALPFDVSGKLRFGIWDLMSVILVFAIVFGLISQLPEWLMVFKPLAVFWALLFAIDVMCSRLPAEKKDVARPTIQDTKIVQQP